MLRSLDTYVSESHKKYPDYNHNDNMFHTASLFKNIRIQLTKVTMSPGLAAAILLNLS